MKLLSTNFRLDYGSLERGYLAVGLSLAPNVLSGHNVCPASTPGCESACNLWFSGRSVMGTARDAKIRRTNMLYTERDAFFKQLEQEIALSVKRADKKGLRLAVRLNTASDILWEAIAVRDKLSVMELFPNVYFYDYTKVYKRMQKYLHGVFPANYNLTFSRSELNDSECKEVLLLGGNVAVVFSGGFPDQFSGYRVIDGDQSDLRFLDDRGVIVGLGVKGAPGKRDETGFVIYNKTSKGENHG